MGRMLPCGALSKHRDPGDKNRFPIQIVPPLAHRSANLFAASSIAPAQHRGRWLRISSPDRNKKTLCNFLSHKALCLVEDSGLEPDAESPCFRGFPDGGGAESGAPDARNPTTAGELGEVIEAWPALPLEVRREVLRLVRIANGSKAMEGNVSG